VLCGAGAFGVSLWLVVFTVVERSKRATLRASGATKLDNARLERLEHSVDAIAIEMERIGETLRFTTKLLSERAAERLLAHNGATDAAPAEPPAHTPR